MSYFDGKPQKGKSEFSFSYDGGMYRFTGADTLARFRATPDNFTPAYGVWCAWAMLDGKKVKVNPLRYKIVDGINYLFYDGFWGDTLVKWNEKGKKETEKTLIKTADEQWQKIVAQ